MILDLFIYIIQFYINQNTFLPGFIIRKREPKFPYIRSATILNTNTTTNKIPIHLINLNATLIPK